MVSLLTDDRRYDELGCTAPCAVLLSVPWAALHAAGSNPHNTIEV